MDFFELLSAELNIEFQIFQLILILITIKANR